jgi:aminomethyltransferase
MKETVLTPVHIELGAKMAEFAGYNMPIVYSSIQEEHLAVRNNVGVFDVSHMGEFIIRGKEALNLVQYVTSNDASKLEIGQAQYSCLPNENGGIVDDLLVYRLTEEMCSDGEQAFMLVVNASNIEKDWNWISSHNHFDTQMINISSHAGLIAVQGPNAIQALQPLTKINLAEMKYYTFEKGEFAGIENVLISATGYTGSGGFEIYVDNQHLKSIWETVFEAGRELDVVPVGLGARDTLRLEMGYCLYGNDIDDHTSPLEAGLGWITKLKKEEFISIERLKSQKEKGLEKKLVGFVIHDRRVPRHGYKILDENEQEIGVVTSGTLGPSVQKPIGMGYVPTGMAKSGQLIKIQAGRKLLKAEIVRPPFYKNA